MATFTERQLEISNKSYTNKDFESIYLELLQTAEKISNRFSPTHANEADPFIILLKLVAVVADKINYNVDKNILERFLLSCTQEKSMRELTEMLGYNMSYYNSAQTSVVFKYNFSKAPSEDVSQITIPAFSIISNGDDIQYITTQNAVITKEQGVSQEVDVIEGYLKELQILGSNVIQLENLDANNRLYLPEVMIAENGVSINSAITSNAWQSWDRSENLNTEIFGTLVYKFSFDSVRNLPYIEFPTWIADIIGDGLSVKYLVTKGRGGNISAKSLISVTRTNVDDDINDADIVVFNASAATSGRDPETLNDAYAGFKRVIGTFDTLVTCRDYANAIYELMTNYSNYYVSNVQVGDRRCDLNYSCDVITATGSGMQTTSIIGDRYDYAISSSDITSIELDEANVNKIYYTTNTGNYYVCKKLPDTDPGEDNFGLILLDESEIQPKINPYDLCLYLLNPISNTSYIAVDDANGYNKSYNLISQNSSSVDAIKANLEQNKTMTHTYKDLATSDLGYIQNLYKLDATVNTARKVNLLEQTEILININNALIAKYNPRNLNFGAEIAFDELLTTIEQADPRIKSASVQEPEQTPKIILANNAEVDLYNEDGSATDQFKFIIAKNLLAGRIEAFAYDTDFNYNFKQKDARKYTNIVKAKTEANIAAFPEATTTQYTLNENESIQFLAPNLHTEVTYPYGINYYLELAPGKDFIAKDAEYKLSDGDLLIFNYRDNNDVDKIEIYGQDNIKIVKSNIDLYTTAYRNEVLKQTPTKIDPTELRNYIPNFTPSGTYKFYTLAVNDKVEIRDLVFDTLDVFRKCYWITNQPNNMIDWIGSDSAVNNWYSYTYVLNDGEYFFYADSALTSLYSFGAGTRLNLSIKDEIIPADWAHNNYINIDAITQDGLSALGDYFINKAFDPSAMVLKIYENEILTLTAGDVVQLTVAENEDGSPYNIPNNIFEDILYDNISDIKYRYESDDEGDLTALPDRSTLISDGAGWEIRSLLDFNVGPNMPQVLVGNQKITFTPGSYDSILRRFIPYTEISSEYTGGDITLTGGEQFECTKSLVTGGGENVNLEYMDIDLSYKCPSILVFTTGIDSQTNLSALADLGSGYYNINLNKIITADQISEENYSAQGSITMYTSPADYIDISDEEVTISGTADNEVAADKISDYFNNKLYYSPDRNSYYQCVRRCLVSTDMAADHDSLYPDLHKFVWQKVSKYTPSTRIFMLYVSGIQETESGALPTLKLISNFASLKRVNGLTDDTAKSELLLQNGINVVEVSDQISGSTVKLCESVVLSANINGAKTEEEAMDGLSQISILLSELKLKQGINPLLGIKLSDDIIGYLRSNFKKQFNEFFINATLDEAKHIELSRSYPLNSAQAFYDTNNIASKWVMCKIDFTNSNIKIARSSKQ